MYGHIIMTMFTSDGLLYVYKTYKVIKLYWHVSLYNNIIIVIYIYIYNYYNIIIQTNMPVQFIYILYIIIYIYIYIYTN